MRWEVEGEGESGGEGEVVRVTSRTRRDGHSIRLRAGSNARGFHNEAQVQLHIASGLREVDAHAGHRPILSNSFARGRLRCTRSRLCRSVSPSRARQTAALPPSARLRLPQRYRAARRHSLLQQSKHP